MSHRDGRGTVDPMQVSTAHDVPAPPAPPAPQGERWRRPLRWFGIACLMGAAFFGGYVGWLLWGTGVETARAQDELRSGIEGSWTGDGRPPTPDEPSAFVPGDAYAVILIPSVGVNYVVVQGTGYEALKEGPGHYVDTADPWDGTGRVGIAGHRTTYMAPFSELDQVADGDEIELVTEFGSYTYEVTRNFVVPEEGSGFVLDQTERPTLVLTTCNPKFASYQRLIVEAKLVGAGSEA
jgi:sortase A